MQSVNKRVFFPFILLSPLFDLKIDYFRRHHFPKWLSQAFHPLTRFQASAKNQQEFDTHVCVLTVKLSPHNHLLQLNGSKTPHYWALYVYQPIFGGKDFSSVKPDLSAWNWLEKLCLVSLKTLKAPGCRSVDFLYLLWNWLLSAEHIVNKHPNWRRSLFLCVHKLSKSVVKNILRIIESFWCRELVEAAFQGLCQKATLILMNFSEVLQVSLISQKNETSRINVLCF